jgi:membrane-associated phospholipid phosphatase
MRTVELSKAIRFGMPAAWAVLSVVMLALNGLPTSHGLIFLWLGLGMAAFSVSDARRRFPRLLLDWAPLISILLVYDLLRGYADGLVFHAHELPQVQLERWIFGKPIPTVWLHRHLWHGGGDLRWWDYVVWFVYLTHFLATTSVAASLWIWAHDRFARFATMVCTLAFAGYATYVLYPAVPPWMAAQDGNVGEATRVVPIVWANVPIAHFDAVFQHGLHYANNVAAMPSLHAAYSLLLSLYLWRLAPRLLRPLVALYPLVMAFALVYGGEHYVVDIVAGWIYAAVVFFAVNRVFDRRSAREPRPSAEPALVD